MITSLREKEQDPTASLAKRFRYCLVEMEFPIESKATFEGGSRIGSVQRTPGPTPLCSQDSQRHTEDTRFRHPSFARHRQSTESKRKTFHSRQKVSDMKVTRERRRRSKLFNAPITIGQKDSEMTFTFTWGPKCQIRIHKAMHLVPRAPLNERSRKLFMNSHGTKFGARGLVIIDTVMFRNEIFGMDPNSVCSIDR